MFKKKETQSRHAAVAALVVGMAVIGIPGSAEAIPGPCAFPATGTFHVTADAECIGDGIVVGAHNTKIFLDGHTLTGDGFSTGIVGGAFDKLKIFGPGTLTGWGVAVDLTDTDKAKVFDVSALNSDTGFLVTGEKNHFLDNTASNNTSWGFGVTGEKNHLQGNILSANGGGIRLSGDKAKAMGNNVTGSTGTGGTDGDGIFVPAGQKVDVKGNTSSTNAGDGVDADTNYITINDNTLESNTLFGATAPDEKKVKGTNTCIGNNGGGAQGDPPRLCKTPPD